MPRERRGKAKEPGGGPLMADVARVAGVATSTVSRALANPGRVNEQTRRKIAAAAEKLGYTPNAAARSLRVGKSDIVMIVLPGPLFYGASQVVPEVLQNIDATLVRKGFNLLISNLDRLAETEKHIVDLAFSGTVRGAIVLSSDLPQSGNRSLADAGIPIVALLRDLSETGVPSVVTNDRGAMREAVAHLIGLGHRSFFYVAGPSGNYHEIERFAGLNDALAEAGLPADSAIRFDNDYDFQHHVECGTEAAARYLALESRPTAAACCSDDAAIAFLTAVRRAGIAVPEEVSVVGFDGSLVGNFCEPPLTTLKQPTAELGAAAADTLLALLAEEESGAPLRTVLPSHLLMRGSTCPAGKAASGGSRSVT